MILWIVFAALGAGAVALVALPLIRVGRPAVARNAHELEIYRDQLDEVGRDLERGQIGADQAEAARTEISRRILALDAAADAGETPEDQAAAPVASRARLPAIAAALLVPALAAIVYVSHGRPDLPGLPAAERQAAAPSDNPAATELRARIADLAAALEKDPQGLRNWIALGDALSALKRHDQAAVSYRQAMRLAPGNAELASLYGEALAFANGGQVTPDGQAAFEEALRRDAGEPRAHYYLGLAARQGGRQREALGRWLALEAGSAPDAPWIEFLKPRIAALASELGLDAAALDRLRAQTTPIAGTERPAAPGPTREQVEAAREMSAEDRQEMIRGMVDRLAARLEESPDDAEGWLRLARARGVLGEKDAAKAAYAKAAALRPEDVDVLTGWADSIVDAAAPGPPPPVELSPVVDRILARNPAHPRALWLAGALAVSAGDGATARTRWTRLLDLLDPDSVQYVELRKQIDALPGGK